MKPILRITLGVFLFVFAAPSWAATPVHSWSLRAGGTLLDFGSAVAVDGSGNVVMVGSFQGTADFGGGPLVSAGVQDIFIAKYNASGAHQWSKRFGDTSIDQVFTVKVDGSGNVVVAGSFRGTVDFGGGPLVSVVGGTDIFLVKYDANGVHQWSQRIGDNLPDQILSVALDGSGNVVVTGIFAGTVDFGGGPLVSLAGITDIFVAKYNASGVHQWSQRFGGTGNDIGRAVAVDGSGNVLVTGYFPGTADFGGGPLASAGVDDIFVAKYDASGVHQWSQRFGGVGSDQSNSLAVDGTGNVVVTGQFSGTVDFGGGPLASAGGFDIFVAKYDANGVHQWSQRFGDTLADLGRSVALDGSGNAVVTGGFNGTVDFGGGNLVTAGSGDVFMAMYDPSGAHQWSQRLGSTGTDSGAGVALDGSGNVLVAGSFQGTVSFGGDPLVSAGSSDIFLAKYMDEEPFGNIAGCVRADCPQSDTPLQGVTVDAFEVGSGALVAAAVTDALGCFLIEGIPAGDYTVTLVTPLGYSVTAEEVVATVPGGGVAAVDYALSCMTIAAQPRSMGYWKHQVAVATGAPGSAQIDAATLCDYFDIIELHFNNNGINPILVYTPPISGDCADVLEVAKSLLNLKGSATMVNRAKQQLTALLLNVAGGKISLREVISADGATVSQAITYCDELIVDLDLSNDETAKDIADMINNGILVPAGMVSLATPDIPYAPGAGGSDLPHELVLKPNYPNPFNPTTAIEYELPVASDVRLAVYDVTGRLVRTLERGHLAAGRHDTRWEGQTNSGEPAATGVYWLRLEASGQVRSIRMVLMK